MTYADDGYAHIRAAEKLMETGDPSVDQLAQMAIANFLGGILAELDGVRLEVNEVACHLRTVSGWLQGNVAGRPEVVVHQAEDIIHNPTQADRW